MPQSSPIWRKINQRLTSEPRTTGAYTVQLVAQLSGWQLRSGTAAGGISAAQLRLQPTMLRVRHGAEESVIPLVDPVRFTETTLIRSALAISVVCGLIMLVARSLSKNHLRQSPQAAKDG